MDIEMKDVIASLEKAVARIDGEKDREKREYEARQAELLKRERQVRAAITALRTTDDAPADKAKTNGSTKPRVPRFSISDERYQKVIAYLEKHPRSRQVDIQKKSGLNSGTVSVALRKLEVEGRIKREEPEDGSTMWVMPESSKKEGKSNPRETVVVPGKGTHRGRLKVAA